MEEIEEKEIEDSRLKEATSKSWAKTGRITSLKKHVAAFLSTFIIKC